MFVIAFCIRERSDLLQVRLKDRPLQEEHASGKGASTVRMRSRGVVLRDA